VGDRLREQRHALWSPGRGRVKACGLDHMPSTKGIRSRRADARRAGRRTGDPRRRVLSRNHAPFPDIATLVRAGNRRAELLAVRAYRGRCPGVQPPPRRAEWTGASLADVPAEAGAGPDVVHIGFTAPDVTPSVEPQAASACARRVRDGGGARLLQCAERCHSRPDPRGRPATRAGSSRCRHTPRRSSTGPSSASKVMCHSCHTRGLGRSST
jgi:hypothetical protein